MSQVQVADEGAHEARFADTGCQGEAERRKLAFEVGDRGNSLRITLSAGEVFRLRGGTISVTRSRISSEWRWGGRKLRRPEMALTWRFISSSP